MWAGERFESLIVKANLFLENNWVGYFIIFACLILAAVASVAETTIIPITRLRIRHLSEERHSRAEAVERLVSRPHVFLSSILAVKSMSIIAASILAAELSKEYVPDGWSWAIAIFLMGCITLIFVETLPKGIASRHSERVASLLVTPVIFAAWLVSPFIETIGIIHRSVLSLTGNKDSHDSPLMTEGDFKTLISVSEEDGILEENEKEMVLHILKLEDTPVREIMVPRIDIIATDADTHVNDVLRLIVENGYSRIPLFDGGIDNIVGILYAKDILKCLYENDEKPNLKKIARQPLFIPETKKVDELLRELQQKRVHIAIVIDEYGGTAGLVTIEDLLEEIVGEIKDEYDHEESLTERVSDDEILVDGRASIGVLGELIGLDLDGENVDTVGGLFYDRLGRIPVPGDKINVNGLGLTVVSTVRRRVKKVRVLKESKTDFESEEKVTAEIE